MRRKLVEMLACPRCGHDLACLADAAGSNPEIVSGRLECNGCRSVYTIERGIPRFVSSEGYASSFGYQWNRFRSAQIDAINGFTLSEKRLYSETGWSREWMKGRWILDVGCGAGRFLDVAAAAGAEVVGVDLSCAVDAALETLADRPNVHLVQASLYELPFKRRVFDGCYCIGVIQHTPKPQEALRHLPTVLKEGGRIAVTVYERKRWTRYNGKYLIRPITVKMNERVLMALIRGAMPLVFPFTEIFYRLPYLGRVFRFFIPVANYVDVPELSLRRRYTFAMLDTFDMLSPRYDQPLTQTEVASALAAEGVGCLRRLSGSGMAMVGEKQSDARTGRSA